MAIIGTFGTFTTARLGIYASQASLQVTGNNIANINTKGYTRQRADLVSLNSTGTAKYASAFMADIGYGVLTKSISQLRDPYLDIRFRNENAKLGAEEEKFDCLNQIANILDEVGMGDQEFGKIEKSLGDFFTALEDLATTVGDETYDDLVRGAANTLVKQINNVAKDLKTVQENKTDELKQTVSEINKILTGIRDLNVQIRTQGIYGDNALELRDARNNFIDELSKYMHINVEYSMERIDQYTEVEKLTITLANTKGETLCNNGKPIKLVDGIFGGQISIPEEVPVMNPNANAKAIQDTIDAARAKAETDYPISDWDTWIATELAAKKQEIEDANADTKEPWATKIKEARDKAIAGLSADASDADKKAAADAAAAKVNEEREETIKSETARAKRVIENEAAKQRQEKIDTDVAAAEKKAIEVDKLGRYLTKDKEVTNDVTKAEMVKNDKFLVQVETLYDQKGRPLNDAKPTESIVEYLDDTDLMGALQAMREFLTEEGEFASADDLDTSLRIGDDKANTKRGLPYYQKVMDSLAQKLAATFNEANQLAPSEVYQTNAGSVFVKDDGNGNLVPVVDENNNPITKQMVEKPYAAGITDTDAAKYLAIVRAEAKRVEGYESYDGGVLFSNSGNTNDPTGITAENISISTSWDKGEVRVLNTKQKDEKDNPEMDENGNKLEHSTRSDNIRHMLTLFDKQLEYVAKDTQADSAATRYFFRGSFREMYTAIGGTLANDMHSTIASYESHSVMSLDLDNDRQSVAGVDLNDEATSMMQYQKSYQAACRLLTTIDSMLDTLINGTAR